MTVALATPGLQRGMAVVAAAVGLWLVMSALRRAFPDPIRQALRGHPLEMPHPDPFDRLLDRWDETVGTRRRRSSLLVMRIPASRFRRIQVTVATVSGAIAVGLLLLTGGSGWLVALLCPPLSLASATKDGGPRPIPAPAKNGVYNHEHFSFPIHRRA